MRTKWFEGIKKEQVLFVMYVIVILSGLFKIYMSESDYAVEALSMPVNNKVILLDAGHGGWDPGKVGEYGLLEKDINLQVTEKLQKYLEQGGAYVLTTRAEDVALSENKRQDLNNRTTLANAMDIDIFVSIHQNSYPRKNIKGAQVFYYADSEKSQLLAESIQAQLIAFLDPSNKRMAKSNTDYYMLKKTSAPSVIVECGFLSNENESYNLSNDEYQQKLAWSIYMGIIDYFNTK